MSEDVIEQSRNHVEDTLSTLDFVDWDRFVVGEEHPEHGDYINVYGWIPRNDGRADFVLVEFFPDTEDDLMGFTTSSDEWTEEIYRRMFGEEPEEHNDCQRVEHTYEIPNAVTLNNQPLQPDTDRSGETNE